MKRVLATVVLCVLAACGGGDGGSDSNLGSNSNIASPTQPSTGLQISLDTNSLNFNYNEGDLPAGQNITAIGVGNVNQNLYIGGTVSGTGIATPISVVIDPRTGTGKITVRPQSGLTGGIYSGTIQLLACATPTCAQQHGGSPFNIPYKVTVLGRLKTAASTVDLAAPESGSSTASQLTVTLPAGADGLQATIGYQGNQTGWLNAEISANGVKLQASAAALVAGTYKANLILSANKAASSLTIPVTFTVSTGLVVPAQSTLRFDSETTAATARQSVPVSIAPGATATSWSAISDQNWLQLDTVSGDFGTRIAWHIDLPNFAQLANNASYKATIRVQPNRGTARDLVVNVDKRLAQIKYLDLLALRPGEAGEMLVFGNNFDTLAVPEERVRVDGVAPLAVARVGAGLLRLSLPAMEAGDHVVSLSNASALPSTAGIFKAIAPRTYLYRAIATAGRKTQLVWDAVSQNAYVVNQDLKSVMRYSLASGAPMLAATRSFASIDSIGLAPDHGSLLLKEGRSRLYRLSLADLTTLKTIDLSSLGVCCSSSDTGQNLPVMGDGGVFMSNYGWVDIDNGSARMLNFGTTSTFGAAEWGAISGNGMRMLLPDSGQVSPHGPIFRYEITDNVFQAVTPGSDATFFYRYAVNRDGSSWLFNDKVYGFDLTFKGNVRLPNGWYGNRAAMSRSGARTYYYAQSSVGTDKARIYVFDTSAALTSTLDFPVLGYFEVADKPNCPNSANSGYYDGCYTYETRITLTDDEQTLLLAGDRNFVVVPIPVDLRVPTITATTNAQFLVMRGSL